MSFKCAYTSLKQLATSILLVQSQKRGRPVGSWRLPSSFPVEVWWIRVYRRYRLNCPPLLVHCGCVPHVDMILRYCRTFVQVLMKY
eukprot:scaffold56964_cov49-Prasinocladus_malaysianus.AAC.2